MLRLQMPSSNNNVETMFVQQAVPTITLLSAVVMTATAMTTRAGMASMLTAVVTTTGL
jgi:hypothetical protein